MLGYEQHTLRDRWSGGKWPLPPAHDPGLLSNL